MKKGCSVFVGNIDFDVPEEKLIEQLGAVGRVVSFRMVYDYKTKKSKGYGFCEYENKEIAQLAVKSLNFSFNNRQVKINYAENDIKRKSSSWKIEDVLKKMDKVNLLDVLKYLKNLAINNITELKKLLRDEQFCALVIGVLVKLNLIDEEGVCEIVGRGMGMEGAKEQILLQILQTKDDDMASYDEDVKEKLLLLKSMLVKKE